MNQYVPIFKKLITLLEAGVPVACATIISASGSVPRRESTRMLVADDGSIQGSIGGGVMEHDVITLARQSLISRTVIIKDFLFSESKTRKKELICGGRLTVMIEPMFPPDTAIICGAGHVGHALYSLCRSIDFRTIIIDDREDYATRQRFPEAEMLICDSIPRALAHLPVRSNNYVIVCTRRHDVDQQCLEAALKKKPAYIGMLGSRTKWAQIKKNLRSKGFSTRNIARVHCPIGLDIGAVTPEEIAVSIAAELINHRNSPPPQPLPK